ncbi:hypothetical protein Q1695_005643 [Nippostrongylus brasiliensis]|nr:hypothetical protein Q1695_005643 [Nippostrongylus brasiliensis]
MFGDLEQEVEPLSPTKREIPCRVCERIYNGSLHFGIEICRACAMFFRRSVEGRKKFLCQKGGDGCRLNASRRTTCQKCRLIRCLTIGLRPELVRPRVPGRLPRWPSTLKAQLLLTDGELLTEMNDPKDVWLLEDSLRGQESSLSTTDTPIFRPVPTNPAFSSDSKPNLICKVLHNYRKLYDDRCAMEQTVPGPANVPTITSGGKTFSLCTINRVSDILRKQATYITRFIFETFEDFETFTSAEHEAMIAGLFGALWELEGSYWTYRIFPKQQQQKHMLTLTTYIDSTNLDYLINDHTTEKMDITQLKQVITSLLVRIRSTLLDQMHRIILSEVEFVALISLTLWSQRFHRGSEKAERIASRYRAQIFDDLHAHYRDDRKMDNYAARVGDVMSLFVDLQMNNIIMKEDVELLKLFNMYKSDSYVYDCFNNVTSKRI